MVSEYNNVPPFTTWKLYWLALWIALHLYVGEVAGVTPIGATTVGIVLTLKAFHPL